MRQHETIKRSRELDPERIRMLGNEAACVHDPQFTQKVTWALYSGLFGVLYHMDWETEGAADLAWSQRYSHSLLVQAYTSARMHVPGSTEGYRYAHLPELFTRAPLFAALKSHLEEPDPRQGARTNRQLEIFNSTMIDGYAHIAQDEQATVFVQEKNFERYLTQNLRFIDRLLEETVDNS